MAPKPDDNPFKELGGVEEIMRQVARDGPQGKMAGAPTGTAQFGSLPRVLRLAADIIEKPESGKGVPLADLCSRLRWEAGRMEGGGQPQKAR